MSPGKSKNYFQSVTPCIGEPLGGRQTVGKTGTNRGIRGTRDRAFKTIILKAYKLVQQSRKNCIRNHNIARPRRSIILQETIKTVSTGQLITNLEENTKSKWGRCNNFFLKKVRRVWLSASQAKDTQQQTAEQPIENEAQESNQKAALGAEGQKKYGERVPQTFLRWNCQVPWRWGCWNEYKQFQLVYGMPKNCRWGRGNVKQYLKRE